MSPSGIQAGDSSNLFRAAIRNWEIDDASNVYIKAADHDWMPTAGDNDSLMKSLKGFDSGRSTVPVKATSTSRNGTPQSSAWRTLLVDDAAPIRTMLQRQLMRAGPDVTIAKNGKEGLEIWEQALLQAQGNAGHSGVFDAVVTNITMPLLNGDEMVREMCALLQSEHEWAPKPVFIGATAQYQQAGVDKVLLKPFKAADVLDALSGCKAAAP